MKRGLYLVTPGWSDTGRLLAASRAALEGGATVLQYRHKMATPQLKLEQAHALRILTHEFDAALVINDEVLLALAVGADALHIGREDGDPREMVRAVGKRLAIGVSCYDDFERARTAVAAGAAYVAFGAMYPSPTKPEAVAAPHELIGRAKAELDTSVACIGGITADNAAPLVAAGADWVAVITDIYNADDGCTQAARYTALFA